VKKTKTILLVLGTIVLLVAAALIFLLQNIDGIVKAAIEKYGSEAAGTAVRVESVRIELKNGTGSIRGVTVANPSGFSAANLFSLGEVAIVLDASSLTSDLPVIKEIRIAAPAFRYEVNARAQTNLGIIQQNLKHFSASGGQRSEAASKKETGETRLLVKRLSIADGQGTLDLSAFNGRTLEAKMPPVTLTDIGGRRGVTPAALGETVLAALVKSLEQTAARQGIDQAIRGKLDEEAGRLEQKLDEKLTPGAGDALKKMLGQ